MWRRHTNNRHDSSEIALSNFALTFAKALLVLCVVMVVMISAKQGQDGTKQKAEYLIEAEWVGEGSNTYDVDLWTRTADGNRVMFTNKESGVVFLERDDLGKDCQTKSVKGATANTCQEITVIRGIEPGTYEAALHLYSANGGSGAGPVTPVVVHVKIERLNPTTETVWQGTVILDQVRQERPVILFEINADGSISNLTTDDLPSLVFESVNP